LKKVQFNKQTHFWKIFNFSHKSNRFFFKLKAKIKNLTSKSDSLRKYSPTLNLVWKICTGKKLINVSIVWPNHSSYYSNICHATVTVTLPKPEKHCNIINRFIANFRKLSQIFANFRNLLILAKKIRKKGYIFIRITVRTFTVNTAIKLIFNLNYIKDKKMIF
jgi:hypothetical protein